MIKRVYYPGLESHPHHDIATAQMSGFGGVVSFDVKGGYKDACRFSTTSSSASSHPASRRRNPDYAPPHPSATTTTPGPSATPSASPTRSSAWPSVSRHRRHRQRPRPGPPPSRPQREITPYPTSKNCPADASNTACPSRKNRHPVDKDRLDPRRSRIGILRRRQILDGLPIEHHHVRGQPLAQVTPVRQPEPVRRGPPSFCAPPSRRTTSSVPAHTARTAGKRRTPQGFAYPRPAPHRS